MFIILLGYFNTLCNITTLGELVSESSASCFRVSLMWGELFWGALSCVQTFRPKSVSPEVFWYHKLRKTFSKFYRRHYELVSKFNVGLKTLLHRGLSEPEFYGDLVYKFKKIVGRADFSDQFRKIIVRYKRIGYNINIMRQSACLVFNPITVNNFASLFNCTPVGRASDSMMAPT